MTVDDVAKRVERIRQIADDFEMAHGDEDALHQDVLRAIADGAPDAVELAKAALETQKIRFARHCA